MIFCPRSISRPSSARLGEASVGGTAVVETAEPDAFEVVLLAPDAGESVRTALEELGDEVFVFDELRPEALRNAFGRDVQAVGVPPGDRAAEIGRIAEKLICLDADDSSPRSTDG